MEVTGLSGQRQGSLSAPDSSVGSVLRLIGSEPAGAILMELGQRPLRTKQLTERIPDFSARTVYRSLGSLEEHGLVERRAREASSPVQLRLTEPAGRNLFRLLRSLSREFSWDSLCLLGEMWRAGFTAELSHGSRSLIDLLESTKGLTYHQVRRRTTQFVDEGFLENCPHRGNGRHYQLADHGRRCMIVIVAIGRWRHRYLLADETAGLELAEMVTVLRSALPIVTLPRYAGAKIDFVVTGAEDKYGRRDEVGLRCAVGEDGALQVSYETEGDPDGSAAATLNTWFAALLDGNRGRVRVRGDLTLVDGCLTQLYDLLWEPLKL
jgi:DNA-binding HxlR family transcriptional regulator